MVMKTFILTIFIFCCAIWSLKGQNLVPNPSFEEYTSCLGGTSQFHFTTGWGNFGGSPDYYNSCCIYPHAAGVPNNFCGHQYAQDGNAYAGIGATFTSFLWWREFIAVQLKQPLIIGQQYYVSFYASLTLDSLWSMNMGFDKLGAKFLTNGIQDSTDPSYLVNNTAQIYTNTVIADSASWTNITGSFIADSAYQYMIIGFFFDSTHTNYIKFFNNPGIDVCNYYLDNFYVGTTPNGIIEFQEMNLKIYPNPAQGLITIEGTALKSYTIIDMLGRKYKEAEFSDASQNSIYVGDLPKGMYFVAVKTLAGSWVGKVVVQ